VRFLGFLDHATLARHYAACDVFVLPSFVETQGLVAMEAMWFGKPVLVSSSIVSALELLGDTGAGNLIDPGDPGALGRKLESIARHSEFGDSASALDFAAGAYCQTPAVVGLLEALYRPLSGQISREDPSPKPSFDIEHDAKSCRRSLHPLRGTPVEPSETIVSD